ncbi:hypothetical protein CCP3SC5AM1_80032 [Gammaproteobacteria bacterium]
MNLVLELTIIVKNSITLLKKSDFDMLICELIKQQVPNGTSRRVEIRIFQSVPPHQYAN